MKRFTQILLFSSGIFLFSSCNVIEGIFKAGVWSGILLVVAIIAVIIWIISKVTGGRKR
ncbi:hypothetical protein [Sphingobacterium haloxyli]|uniref:hypothetical protein n=1 Tax=Sphingobacterium haloxyli TaxID=2100533 RepID=UPI0013FD25AE|nr:hypothetical protein [Sphingobacterium haloxyli]